MFSYDVDDLSATADEPLDVGRSSLSIARRLAWLSPQYQLVAVDQTP